MVLVVCLLHVVVEAREVWRPLGAHWPPAAGLTGGRNGEMASHACKAYQCTLYTLHTLGSMYLVGFTHQATCGMWVPIPANIPSQVDLVKIFLRMLFPHTAVHFNC